MPIKQAAIKALRQARAHAKRNLAVKSTINRLLKRSEKSIAQKKLDEARTLTREAAKALDKAVRSKIFKQNTASRIKSRLMKKLNSIVKK